MPSHAALNNDAPVTTSSSLGFHYSVTSPVFSESTVSTTTADGAPRSQSQEEVSYTVAVHGIDTDQGVSFSVNARNTVVYAQGPAFGVMPVPTTPCRVPSRVSKTLNSLGARPRSRALLSARAQPDQRLCAQSSPRCRSRSVLSD